METWGGALRRRLRTRIGRCHCLAGYTHLTEPLQVCIGPWTIRSAGVQASHAGPIWSILACAEDMSIRDFLAVRKTCCMSLTTGAEGKL